MRRKRVIFVAALAVLLIGTVVGGTFAALRAGTKTDKTISTSNLDVKLHMNGSGVQKDGDIVYSAKDMKNGSVKETVYASNEGKADLYVRIKINRAWYDNTQKVTKRLDQNVEGKAIGINFVNSQDWLLVPETDANKDDIYIYYRKKLASGAQTSDMMDGISLLKGYQGNTNHYADLSAKINFDAEAVQTIAAEKAMLKEWGVTAELDEDGTIKSISNQTEISKQ